MEILFRNDENKEQRIKDYETAFNNPLFASRLGYLDDIVMPSKTRALIADNLVALEDKNRIRPTKSHELMQF